MAQRGSYAKGIAKREEILTTALDVIAREGYRGASVKELAEAVGLSQAGLLHYFDSKDELFTAILRKRDELDLETYRTESDVDPLRIFLRVMRHNADVPGLVELYTRLNAEASDHDHPAHQFFAERRATMTELFGGLVADGKRTGRYPADLDTASFALVLTAAADGLQTLWLQDPTIDMASELERLLVSLGALSPERSTTA
ncbi:MULTISPECIES: TetR/AcrR family transcriptional regulator [Oerskovia]|uniref:TetR/AcrR family transcriptional regulator n=1 Tax=Oerskovia rustica TaxID=2762237 RepID=A0ABR8RW05_9CELL|nr:TetR/AcrR family transcriptional regulator [Oerskovia rustica]MBD7951928.1 TetR/AcrR family transcriptional regulator [Oerskovia rustica]